MRCVAILMATVASNTLPLIVCAQPALEVTENSLGMRLVEIPAGEFDMGSSDGPDEERPVHRVRITKTFLLAQTEVTRGQWRKVMDTSPWQGKDFGKKEGAELAATYLSWADAVEFCERLTVFERSSGRLRGSQRYRLPTEAEWEYACRAGTKTRWSFGDDEGRLGEFAWFLDNALGKNEQCAQEVARKKPNPWKLHDMHGNVSEWCSDAWKKDYYAISPLSDPQGPVRDSDASRVLRGGNWAFPAAGCRSASRFLTSPNRTYAYIGLRVACEAE